MDVLDRVYADYDALLGSVPDSVGRSDAVREIAWMIEELRVNLFAQTLGTLYPVSEKRVRKAIDDVRRAVRR
jgi:ATP-dependent helicase HrpA